jgi:hypothetical protein
MKLDMKVHPTLHDQASASAMITNFEASLPSWDLYNCADAAVLLVDDFDSCGIAKLDVTSSCRTLSITAKDCATGYYRLLFKISSLIHYLVSDMKSATTLGPTTTGSRATLAITRITLVTGSRSELSQVSY